jgi:predicted transcriptional regulator
MNKHNAPVSLGELANKVGLTGRPVPMSDVAAKIGYTKTPMSLGELAEAVDKHVAKHDKK